MMIHVLSGAMVRFLPCLFSFSFSIKYQEPSILQLRVTPNSFKEYVGGGIDTLIYFSMSFFHLLLRLLSFLFHQRCSNTDSRNYHP